MKKIPALLIASALCAGPLFTACGGSCPHACEHSAATSTSGGERPSLAAEVDVPERIVVSLDGLEGELDDRHVFDGFGCTGRNHSPAISWSGAPEGTQSFLLEVHDPDAPTGVGFFHWIVADLPASTSALGFDAAASGLPEGVVQTRTDLGTNTFGGPCPPPGAPHRYVFTVYALDVPSLGVGEGTPPAVVRFMLRGHVIALGRAVATFGFPAQ